MGELISRKGDLRQIAMELLYRLGGLRGPKIGEIFRIGYTSVSQERIRLRERILSERRIREVINLIERKL
ncbi:MAG: hypothetical protein HXY53_07535 [Nitrospirae bacterium]|nr:hypothetical protein [Nitrospirota bacterium]